MSGGNPFACPYCKSTNAGDAPAIRVSYDRVCHDCGRLFATRCMFCERLLEDVDERLDGLCHKVGCIPTKDLTNAKETPK